MRVDSGSFFSVVYIASLSGPDSLSKFKKPWPLVYERASWKCGYKIDLTVERIIGIKVVAQRTAKNTLDGEEQLPTGNKSRV
jgi:hypothetical protein